MNLAHRPDVPAWLLALVALICITILTALHDTVPSVLEVIAGGAVVGGAALPSAPRGQRATDTTTKGR
jgi:hypothetical protein